MKTKKSLLLLLLFAILLIPSAYSQDLQNKNINQPVCGTPPMTEQQRKYTLNFVDKVAVKRKVGITYIPIRIHRVTLDDGTGGIEMGNVNEGVANLNNFYSNAGIEYYTASVNTIESSDWYTFDISEEPAMVDENSTYDAVNVYFVDTITFGENQAAGYAYYPANGTYSLNILMDNQFLSIPNGTFVHEFGHFFNLAHTHDYTTNGNTDPYAENVPRAGVDANCDTNGDMLCDTQADPNGSDDANCNFVNDGASTTDINGVTYTPDIENIMSYYRDACGGNFTPEQYTRVTNGLSTRLTHTTYTLDAAPNNVANASGLTAVTNNSYGIDLNWTDNATNEEGYLIERSSDNGATWLSVLGGGVDQNITTFNDTTISSSSSYKYRIKASNDSGNDYSNEVSIDTGLLYCTPTHAYESCDTYQNGGLGDAIYNLELDGDGNGDISNLNNGCAGPLSIFSSDHSADVTAGNNYIVTGDFFLNGEAYMEYLTIWMDVNQDGDFDDANEMIYQADAAVSTFSAPITIPLTAINGATTMRLRTDYYAAVTSPCGYIAYSEAEDYELIVSGSIAPDTTPPVFENSTPNQSSVTQTSFTLGTDINEAGTIYYVVIADGESTPSSAEVKTGTGSGGAGQVTSGSAAVTAGAFSNNFSVTNLISKTAYDVYVIAEDDNGTPNLQVSPVKIDVTTLPYPDPTITFSSINNTYGNANFNLAATSNSGGTMSYSIEGANTTGTTLSGTNSETVTLGNVGSITLRATQAANGNFSSGTQDITLKIGAAALTVTANASQTKVYGETEPTLTYTIADFVNGDNEAGLDTGVVISRVAGENVGDYTITTSGAADSNYTISFTGSTLAITPAALTVTANASQTKVYGEAEPTLTYTIADFVNGDNEASLDTEVAISRVAGENVGDYTITTSGAADSNYTISFTGSTLAITPAALTVTANASQTKVYGEAEPTLTYTIADFVNGDNEASLDTEVAISRVAGENVGDYTITTSGAADSNYTISFTESTFAITPVALTVAPSSGLSKVYGATDPTLTFTIDGFVNGDNEASLDTPVSIARATGEDVSNYTITPSAAADVNYSVSFVTAQFAITKAALTVTADASQTKVYGAADPALTHTITGFQWADNEASLDTPVSISRVAGEDVGSYAVTPSGAADVNYTVSFGAASFSITQAALTVTANASQTKVYGATDPTLTFTIDGFVNGDNEASLDTGVVISRVAGENVGDYTITPSNASDTNYITGYVTADFSITKATLTIIGLTGENKVYDGTTEAQALGTPILLGVQTGDVVSLGGAPVFTFASAEIGTGIVITTTGYIISGVDSVNYNLTQPIVSADITAVLSLDDNSLIDLVKIYPNPVMSKLYIKTNSIQLEQVEVCDVLGKIIINTKLNLDKIDVSTLAKGMYLLKIKTNQGTVFHRVIKK